MSTDEKQILRDDFQAAFDEEAIREIVTLRATLMARDAEMDKARSDLASSGRYLGTVREQLDQAAGQIGALLARNKQLADTSSDIEEENHALKNQLAAFEGARTSESSSLQLAAAGAKIVELTDERDRLLLQVQTSREASRTFLVTLAQIHGVISKIVLDDVLHPEDYEDDRPSEPSKPSKPSKSRLMRALTIKQPRLEEILRHGRRLEPLMHLPPRDWLGLRIALHAGTRLDRWAPTIAGGTSLGLEMLPRQAILGTAVISEIVTDVERARVLGQGDWWRNSRRNIHLYLTGVQIIEPILGVRGWPNLWDLDPGTEGKIAALS